MVELQIEICEYGNFFMSVARKTQYRTFDKYYGSRVL